MPPFRCWPGRVPRGGTQVVERLDVALGQARRRNARNPSLTRRCSSAPCREAGLYPAWRTEAAAEPGVEDRILAEHQDGIERLKAFGVPTLSINGQRGFFGPVITSVPTGEDAGELWDHIAWLAARDDFFEYKRSRR